MSKSKVIGYAFSGILEQPIRYTKSGKHFGEPTPPGAPPCEAQALANGTPIAACPNLQECRDKCLACEGYRMYVSDRCLIENKPMAKTGAKSSRRKKGKRTKADMNRMHDEVLRNRLFRLRPL